MVGVHVMYLLYSNSYNVLVRTNTLLPSPTAGPSHSPLSNPLGGHSRSLLFCFVLFFGISRKTDLFVFARYSFHSEC